MNDHGWEAPPLGLVPDIVVGREDSTTAPNGAGVRTRGRRRLVGVHCGECIDELLDTFYVRGADRVRSCNHSDFTDDSEKLDVKVVLLFVRQDLLKLLIGFVIVLDLPELV